MQFSASVIRTPILAAIAVLFIVQSISSDCQVSAAPAPSATYEQLLDASAPAGRAIATAKGLPSVPKTYSTS
ncbi:hypothetical protein D9758_012453 [Tetrapyrgos nigripes]|uniref:Uncharacterized protein n=1 Tax=Tetrapyrgos nigripes TaxID=182062 RepID=A0A8H5FVL2_9AGAR|nr:hypothetical protein D9758_012453 [Tetrapyrgos nigripes]